MPLASQSLVHFRLLAGRQFVVAVAVRAAWSRAMRNGLAVRRVATLRLQGGVKSEAKSERHAGRAGLSLRVVVEAFIPQAGMRSFKKSRDRWEFDDLPLLRSLHAKDPNDTR